MKKYWQDVVNLGVDPSLDFIERRRVRLLNVFNTISFFFVVFFAGMNIVAGSYLHAAFIALGLVLFITPVFYLNWKKRHLSARVYFIIVVLIFINFIDYNSIFQFHNRNNEAFLIGFSALILILYDNPIKTIVFLMTMISTLVMQYVRWTIVSDISTDLLLSLSNIAMGFGCVYLFTSFYRQNLQKTMLKLESYSQTLEKQQYEILRKHNDLTANRKLLRSLVDNLPILIALMDTQGNYLIVNKKYQEVFKLNVADIEGKNSREILGEDLFEQRKPLMERCLAGKESILNYNITLPTGEVMSAYGKYLPLKDENDVITGILVYVTDVSKLKEIEQELIELNTTKDKLLSIVSHDLKAPINSLRGLLTISDSISQKELALLMKDIKGQVDTVSITLDNLLSWVRTQLKGFKVNPQNIDIFKIAQQSIDLYKQQVEAKNIAIKIIDGDSSIVYADRDNMSLVLRNLISNAIKFTPQNGSITLACTNNDRNTVISVKDSGIGMDREHIDIIMNEDKRNVTRIGTEGEVGTGLGLAFTKDVLALNNAKMEIESEEGKGTEIRIVFLRGDGH